VAKLLPFWAPRQLLEGSIDPAISTPRAVAVGLAYTALLLSLTFTLAFRQLRVAAHIQRRHASGVPD
jgi:hypothetical protein